MKKLCIAVLMCFSVGCTVSEDKATRILSDSGYTEITLGGFSMYGCSEDDKFSRKFEAKSPTGQRVSGVLCASWLKGATIRLN